MHSEKKYNFIFFILGTIAMVCAIGIVIRDVYFKKNAEEIKATVVECKVERKQSGPGKGKDVALYVDYIYGGEEYKHILVEQRRAKEHEVGSEITVYIKSSSPADPLADSNSSIWLKILFCGIGFFSIGTLIIVLERKSKRQNEYIKENGITVYAKFNRICKKNKNADSPLQLRCTYRDENNRSYTFLSDGFYNDLTPYFSADEMIEVKVMPENYDKYYIDLEALWEKKTKGYNLN